MAAFSSFARLPMLRCSVCSSLMGSIVPRRGHGVQSVRAACSRARWRTSTRAARQSSQQAIETGGWRHRGGRAGGGEGGGGGGGAGGGGGVGGGGPGRHPEPNRNDPSLMPSDDVSST